MTQPLCCMQFDTITGTALLTDRQKSWRNITKHALGLKPIRPKQSPDTAFKVHHQFTSNWELLR
jgi:hypothetical protein